jgi:adenine deaminase
MNRFTIQGNVPDFENGRFFKGALTIENGHIALVERLSTDASNNLPYILPGFVDSHVHIESSMLVPSEFARLAVVHGTVATVSDPHEIANVCGVAGVDYMIQNAATVNFKFHFGAPSCVPATVFETAGAEINYLAVRELLSRQEIKYLSEMMNFPGVINNDKEVREKISIAHAMSKPVDGHAPGLRGQPLIKYVSAGISTDHECFTKDEALEKLSLGMKIIIREGSAAKNFEALCDLMHEYGDLMMFCSDDKHPDSLVQGHINDLCRRAVAKGIDVFKVLKAACINPVHHYNLDVGLLKPADPADFIVVEDIASFKVVKTYVNGICVAENGITNIRSATAKIINKFECSRVNTDTFKCPASGYVIDGKLPVIEALDGQLITNKILVRPTIENDFVVQDVENDILKIVVVNRYKSARPAVAFISKFGLKSGAIASSVAHDSHNIIAVGTNDAEIAEAINLIIDRRGGVSCVSSTQKKILSLPVAGLMSNDDGYKVAGDYTNIDLMAKQLGSALSAPFMTLSFMALLVIPSLKLSDKGLFDGEAFQFVYR